MSMSEPASIGVGTVSIATSRDGGHSPEFFAQRIVDRLIVVSGSAPEPIKAQALAYRDQMFAVVLEGLKSAIASDRAYIFGKDM